MNQPETPPTAPARLEPQNGGDTAARPSSPANLGSSTASFHAHLAKTMYDGDSNTVTLLSQTRACIRFLSEVDGYDPRGTATNMGRLARFLQGNSWENQGVAEFVDLVQTKQHWPVALVNASRGDSHKYAWHIAEGLLGIVAYNECLQNGLPPSTFHDIVPRIFPELPSARLRGFMRPGRRFTRPLCVSFSIRDLLDEGFMIEPTTNLIHHLEMNGDVIKLYALDATDAKALMVYHRNIAAKAIGIANLGNEVLESYAALTQVEFQDNFKLPVEHGLFKIDSDSTRRTELDDLSVVTQVIRLVYGRPESDRQPYLLAERIYAIDDALRKRRRWYKRLRRDIHKRKKEEPWMFWGAVLALFFGVCTVIQTITSVWSLARPS